MKLFFKAKDGGDKSLVTGYWLIESKRFFSIVLLRFDKGSREAYHTHAFNCLSLVLKGRLLEHRLHGEGRQSSRFYEASPRPFITTRDNFHRVFGLAKHTWVLSIRGPWCDRWQEYLPKEHREITLTHGRRVVA